MIILDTNVLSELMRGEADGDPVVFQWVRALTEQPVTTVVNRAEILAGIALLAPGRRRDLLQTSASTVLDRMGICLPLVGECADEYAAIVARRRGIGQSIGAMDALIASIAVAAAAKVATRDTTGFEDLGITVINPWVT